MDTVRKIGELVRKTAAHSSLIEDSIFKFLLQQRSEVNINQQCVSPEKTLITDLVQIGDDIEDEPLEADVSRARMNPKNPTS